MTDHAARREHQLTANQLRETHETLRVLLQASPVAVCTVALDRTVGAVWNEAAERLFGWSAEEVIGRPLPFVPEESRWESDVLLDRIFEGKEITGIELIRSTRDGRTIDVRLDAAPARDREGTVVGAVAFMADITREKQQRERIENSRDELQAIFDGAPLMQYTLDLDGNVVEVNRMIEQVTGFSREELVGHGFVELGIVEPSHADLVEESIAMARSGRVAEQVEIAIRRRDGRQLLVEATTTRIKLYERDLLMGFAIDVTERRNLERQLIQSQKMEAVGRVAGGVAHDFNNILTAVNGYVHLAQAKAEPSSRLAANLTSILKASRRAARLTEQLLLFSKRAPSALQPMDLNESVAEITKMLSRVIGENIELVVDTTNPPAMIRGDGGQIGQVVMNLVLNARDAMPDGGVLRVETAQEASPPAIRLSIADTGIGMDESTLGRIFEPFFTTKGRDHGTGLGLPVVYGIVEQHGGTINVQSTPGEGTLFDLRFPTEHEPPSPPEPEPVLKPKHERSAATVLLVEDEPAIRDIVVSALAAVGYTVVSAGSIAEARERTASGPAPDVAITDVVLPDGSGTTLAQELDAGFPIIYTSGYLEDREELAFVRENAFAFVQKPFDVTELIELIDKITQGATSEPVSSDHRR